MVTKLEFTEIMKKWLNKYLEKYSKEYNIKIICPKSNLSKIALAEIKKLPNYSSFEFKPDVLGILINKLNKETKLIFLNRTTLATSLKEIGEIICYSRLAKPLESFLVSLRGLPNGVNLLLLDKEKERSILFFDEEKFVILFRYDIEKESIDPNSVYPRKFKGKL